MSEDAKVKEYVERVREAVEARKVDMVNRPPHYTAGDIECIDAIKAALTPEEFAGYCKGCAFKYEWRERHKGGVESLRKAQWYLQKLIDNYPEGKDG